MTLTFIGHGYVGLVTAAIFSDLGNTVWVVGHTKEKIENLKKGIIPIFEPGLVELVKTNVEKKRLFFTLDYSSVPKSDIVFIAVGTPSAKTGDADLSVVLSVAGKIGKSLSSKYTVIATKSTVPVGTYKKIKQIIDEVKPKGAEFDIASVPEFLREGTAISDTLHPDRVVIGTESERAKDLLVELHKPIKSPFVLTNLATAELIKYASNSFLATKISFANSIAKLSELSGANALQVLGGMGMDERIGKYFLSPGPGYGGSCFGADEMVFSLNSPNVVAQRIDTLFKKGGNPSQGDVVEYVLPKNQRVLAFDLNKKLPTLARVKVVTKRPYKGVMVKIKTAMGRTLQVTADHPVIVYKDQDVKILPAAAVIQGDTLMTLCDLPKVEKTKSLNLLELLSNELLKNDIYISSIDGSISRLYGSYKNAIPKSMLKYPEEIKWHDRMSFRLFEYLHDKGVLKIPAEKLQLYTAKGAATKINAVIPVDSDLMRFCGYYIAEGYIGKDYGRLGAVRERVGVCFNENEFEYIEDLQRILERWGLKFITRNATHATTTIVSSRIFAWLIRDVLQCGISSENKALPRMAFNVSRKLREEIIRGAFSGDGSVSFVQHSRNIMLEYATVSPSLRDGLTLLLQIIGIIPSIRVAWMNKSKHPAYIIRISGYGQIMLLKNIFGNKHLSRIEDVLLKYSRHIKQHGFVRHGAFATLEVKEVTHTDVETTVYSLETSTGTLISSSGLVNHNCFPKDVRALISIAKDYDYSFSLLEEVENINDRARRDIVQKARRFLLELRGKTVAILGLSFKPDTDDMRDAPSITIIELLQKDGAKIKAYDPQATENARKLLNDVEFCKDPYEACKNADLLIIVTEWNEFKEMNLKKIKELMKTPYMVDARNIFEPKKAEKLGFKYVGVGRQ